MKILVINAGSSSLKYQLFDMDTGAVLAKGGCEKIGVQGSMGIVTHKHPDKYVMEVELPNHEVALSIVLKLLTDPELGVIQSVDEIGAVGHRIVAGGEKLSVNVVDEEVIKYMYEIVPLNPLHGPPAIAAIKGCKELMPNVPHVVVADTAFYRNMPESSYIYPIPYEYYEKYHIRRYGAHGTSHNFVSQEAAKYLGVDRSTLKMVTCHLGNGSSISAIKNGVCIDTSMGLTPLEGLMMGTRCGNIDPSIIPYLMNQTGMTPDEIDNMMNKKSGFLGVSGVSPDCREVMIADDAGNPRAHLAMDIFYHYVTKFIGAFVAELNGLDVLVFTAGIGENDPIVRERICRELDYLGIRIDQSVNGPMKRGTFGDITAPGSRVKVLVIPTDEEYMIAKETLNIVSK